MTQINRWGMIPPKEERMRTRLNLSGLHLIFMSLMLILAQGPVLPAAAQTSLAVDTLMAKAQADGAVLVIVGMRVAFQPEGRLTSSAAVESQRAAISTAQEALLDQMAGYNVQFVKKFPFIPYMAMQVDAAALAGLAASPEVIHIEEDVAVPPALDVSVPLIGAPTVWAGGYTGLGQVVAILDTGVDKTHPFLAGKVVSEACYSTTNAAAFATSVCPGGVNSTAAGSGVNCNTGIAGCDHGTHVAGIVAGKDNGSIGFNGVAKEASLFAMQVFSRIDNVTKCSPGTSPCALTYNSDRILAMGRIQALSGSYNIAALNMSLGGGRYFSQADCDTANTAEKAAIDSLRSLNIATVIASGNSGYTDSMGSPGCISSAVSVGSTGDGKGGVPVDVVSSFSNSVSFLNLLAPGDYINSSTPGSNYSMKSGTSMATPHVAGAWALLKSKVPSATVDQVLSALTTTGKPVTDSRNGITKPRIQVNLAANALGPNPLSSHIYLPLIIKSSGPTPGFWKNLPGAERTEFYVSPDGLNLLKFLIGVDLKGCGTYNIWKTGSASINNNQFSFSGGLYASGTFDSATAAHGTAGLNSIGPICGFYWTGGPWPWNTTWQSNNQPTSLSADAMGYEFVESAPAIQGAYTAIPVK